MQRDRFLFLAIVGALVSPACSNHGIAPNATAPNSPTNGTGGNGDGTSTVGDGGDPAVVDAGRHRHDLGVVGAADLGANGGGAADLGTGGGGGAGGGGGGGTGPSSPFIDTAAAIHAFLTFDYRLTAAQIPSIASRTDFVWGSGWPTEWHAANPKTYVSYYLTWNQDTTGQPLSWWTANHPDWVMYQCDQKTPATVSGYSNLILDISNPAVQAWQMTQVKTGAAKGYDGIAFDLFALDNHRSACGIFRNGQWVQLYNGTRSDAKYTADVLGWLTNMYTAMHALPKPMGLIPNYTLDRAANDPSIAQVIANVDAVLDEYATGNDGSYVTDSSWVSRMQFVESLQQAGKAYFALSGFSTLDSNAIQWALASYLMTKEHHDAIYVAQVSGTTYGSDAWHAEYSAAVGAACGAMTKSGNVYMRSFANGLAVVNPSSSTSAQYTLPAGTYTDLYGKSVSGSVTLAPHGGLVLLVAGAPRC